MQTNFYYHSFKVYHQGFTMFPMILKFSLRHVSIYYHKTTHWTSYKRREKCGRWKVKKIIALVSEFGLPHSIMRSMNVMENWIITMVWNKKVTKSEKSNHYPQFVFKWLGYESEIKNYGMTSPILCWWVWGGGGIKDGTKMEGIVLWIEWARWGWKWGNFPRK